MPKLKTLIGPTLEEVIKNPEIDGHNKKIALSLCRRLYLMSADIEFTANQQEFTDQITSLMRAISQDVQSLDKARKASEVTRLTEDAEKIFLKFLKAENDDQDMLKTAHETVKNSLDKAKEDAKWDIIHTSSLVEFLTSQSDLSSELKETDLSPEQQKEVIAFYAAQKPSQRSHVFDQVQDLIFDRAYSRSRNSKRKDEILDIAAGFQANLLKIIVGKLKVNPGLNLNPDVPNAIRLFPSLLQMAVAIDTVKINMAPANPLSVDDLANSELSHIAELRKIINHFTGRLMLGSQQREELEKCIYQSITQLIKPAVAYSKDRFSSFGFAGETDRAGKTERASREGAVSPEIPSPKGRHGGG